MSAPFEPLTLQLDLADGSVVLTIRHKVLGHTVATLWYGPDRALELSEAIRGAVLELEGNRAVERPPGARAWTLALAAVSDDWRTEPAVARLGRFRLPGRREHG